MLKWEEPATFIKGATASVRKAWRTLGIETIGDLFLTIPRRYDDFSRICTIRDCQNGDVVTLKGKVVECRKLPSFRKRFVIVRVKIQDETGTMSANFFNQPWILDDIQLDQEIYLSGKIKTHPTYGKQMQSPLLEAADSTTLAAAKITPVYGLSGSLVQKTYRRLIQSAIDQLVWPKDPFSPNMLVRHKLPAFEEAIRSLHVPQTHEAIEQGRRRLAFDELLMLQLNLGRTRKEANVLGAPRIEADIDFVKSFVKELPFELTDDQRKAAWAAMKDMQEEHPMLRLLQGDVGSGKTVVAALLSAIIKRVGQSAAMIAPTEVLAKQHADTFRRLFQHWHIPVLLVTRTTKRLFDGHTEEDLSESQLTSCIEQGNIVLVGTHALLQPGRLPKDLALAIIDEQHRFGVQQREGLIRDLRADKKTPHLLSMTATPIPRSLALTIFGDLHVSTLKEKPAGRLPIKTQVLLEKDQEKAFVYAKKAVERDERVFVVCPLIDPSDVLGFRAVTDECKRLQKTDFEGITVGLLHGRMKKEEKKEALKDFISGKTPVLVSTTVIEVGVDVPDATVMIIEGAERFGLAQLHQLRGRVGRSTKASSCFLITQGDEHALKRLKLLEATQDGFRLAEADLRMRGAGELSGTSQTGWLGFRAARFSDIDLMAAAREEAQALLETKEPVHEETWPMYREFRDATNHLE